MHSLVSPSRVDSFAFWLGADHYTLSMLVRRAPLPVPIDQIVQIYEIRSSSLVGLGSHRRYAIEYRSDKRECLVTMSHLPPELAGKERMLIQPHGLFLLFFKRSWREPTALLIPLFLPMIISLMMGLFGVWNELVLHNQDILQFFANPGCEVGCVRKVLSIHSLVGLLFIIQLAILFLPMVVFFFQAPRYRSSVNYRITQTYSFATVVLGICVFAQLLFFFPFKKYGEFLNLGFDPKVERFLSNLKAKKP